MDQLDTFSPAEAPAAPPLRERADIPDKFKWDLSHIFPDWNAWQRAYDELDRKIGECAAFQGTLARGAERLLAVYKLRDEIGQLEHKVWYYTSLGYDQDQRDNQLNARRQQVQILFAKDAQAFSWFAPELLGIPLATVQAVDRPAAGASDLSLRHRRSLPPAGTRARRQGRAADVALEPIFVHAERRLRGAVHGGRQASDDPAVEWLGRHRHVRAVPRDSRHQPQSERPRGRLSRAARALRVQREHVCVAVQRGPAARLVPLAGARVRLGARCGAPRQQHSHGRGREPDRNHQEQRRTAAPISPAAQEGAGARHLSRLRHDHSAGPRRSAVPVQRRARVAAGVGRAARSGVPETVARTR